MTAITRRLDTALGAREIGKGFETASAAPVNLGRAYEVKPSKVVAEMTGQAGEDDPQEVPRKFVIGAEWEARRGGDRVFIEAQEGAYYRLSNGQKLMAPSLLREYVFIGDVV